MTELFFGYREAAKYAFEKYAPHALQIPLMRQFYINPRHKTIHEQCNCIFIHVPRTAGTSITTTLFQQEVGHALLRAHYAHHPDHTRQAFKFAFVRNPWDRLVSAFHKVKYHTTYERTRNWSNTWLQNIDTFDDFLRQLENPFFRQIIMAYYHFKPQHEFVTVNNKLMLDYCGHFETLNEDFQKVCQHLGVDATLPRTNKSSHRDYRDYYNDTTRQLVARLYHRDIELFHYQFNPA